MEEEEEDDNDDDDDDDDNNDDDEIDNLHPPARDIVLAAVALPEAENQRMLDVPPAPAPAPAPPIVLLAPRRNEPRGPYFPYTTEGAYLVGTYVQRHAMSGAAAEELLALTRRLATLPDPSPELRSAEALRQAQLLASDATVTEHNLVRKPGLPAKLWLLDIDKTLYGLFVDPLFFALYLEEAAQVAAYNSDVSRREEKSELWTGSIWKGDAEIVRRLLGGTCSGFFFRLSDNAA